MFIIRSPRRVSFLALVLFASLMAPAGTAASQAPAAQASASNPLDPVRAKFAPDRRLAVFDVTVERRQDGVAVRGEVESAAAREAVLETLRAGGASIVSQEITVLPDPALGDRTHGLVRVSVANVRGRPAHSAELVTQAIMGWPVRILKQQGGWYLVHTDPEGYLGWIEELQLTRVTTAERQAWEAGARVIGMRPYSILRAAATEDAEPVTDLVIGSILRRAGGSGGWVEASLPDGRRGFVGEGDVRDYTAWKAAPKATPDEIERTARLFMGVPYLWGGTSAKGVDCSGFLKTVMRMHGIEMARDTDQQALEGTAVTVDARFTELRKGDLLFFRPTPSTDGPERITHVGIYLGNLEFIHASGLVRRNSFDPASPIYSENLLKRLARVRRVLP
jgi:cell wall-associated NlpC family hydrolase